MFVKHSLLLGLIGTALWVLPVHAEDAAQKNLEWSVLNGSMNTRMISPSGDILDSGMDALSPLNVAPINMPYAGITADIFKDPKKAKDAIQKAFFFPTEAKKRQELTANEAIKIRANQHALINQTTSYTLTYGLKSDQNASEFGKRRDKAYQFIATGENEREDQQVLNGITLGELAEMNKMLGMTATRAILIATDGLAGLTGL